MASQQLQLRAAIAAALVAAEVLAENRIHEDRAFQQAIDVDKQLHVTFRESEPAEEVLYEGHPIDWLSVFELTVLTRRAGGVEASDAADSVWAAAFAALMADQSLGGLADYLQPGPVSVEHAEADTSLCRLTWSFTLRHRTANNVLT